MIAFDTTIAQLERALWHATQLYDGNLIWNRAPEPVGRALRFTLRVISSKEPGHRVSASAFTHRRLVAACWHAHRDFLRALFAEAPEARVKTAVADYRGAAGFEQTFPGTAKRNIGSLFSPVRMADACECEESA